MISYTDKLVYPIFEHTDKRKSINGLTAIVESCFKLDLFCGALFVFYNRNRDRIKFLNGMVTAFGFISSGLKKGIFVGRNPAKMRR